MLLLILLLVIGTGLVYVSRYNFMLVSLNFGTLIIRDIPLFYVIIGSILFGLILSYLVHLINSISTSFTLREKNNLIKKEQEEVLELTKRIHQLELENERQKNDSELLPSDPNAL